jgi:hypothetical protein
MAVRMSSAASTYSVNLNQLQGPVSVATWFKFSVNRGTYSTVFSIDEGSFGVENFMVCQTDITGSSLEMYPAGSGSPMSVPVALNTWTYLGVSLTGSTATVRMRAQGAPSFTSTTASLEVNGVNQTRLLLGNSTFDETSEWMNGCLASFRIWTGVALTATELEAEYQYASPLRTAGLRAFYKFDSASTTDNSGNGFTLSGGTGATTEAGPTGLIEPGGGGSVINGWGPIPIR